MAMFIRVDIDDAVQQDPALCKQLTEVCPVDIFALEDGGRVTTVEENLDECTLCQLCLQTAPGMVDVVKLYRDGEEAHLRAS
jgi:NAD-dependent dihydropyrimidine dehydrogenase PreA subunit